MNDEIKNPCGCEQCAGPSCTCGCQTAATQEACTCGPQCDCGDACEKSKN
jgi:hypothetical protein